MAAFNPAAWVAEYEALGGHVSVMRWTGEQEGLWLGLTFPRDPEGRGFQLQAELYEQPGEMARSRSLMDYMIVARGVEALTNQ